MVPELETSRVTELRVRMDCNGCVNKIKRAVRAVEGVCDTLVNFPEQKLTVVGSADPELIVKAIKKVRKTATVCTPTEAGENPPPQEEPPAAETTTPDAQPPAEAPAAEPPAEQSNEPPPSAPEPEPEPAGESPPAVAPEVKEVEEYPMVHQYYYPHGYGPSYGEHWSNNYWERDEGPFHVVTHSYNTYRPSATVLEYAYGYGVAQPPAENVVAMGYHGDYYYGQRGRNGGSGNMSSMFSDENPNACRIV